MSLPSDVTPDIPPPSKDRSPRRDHGQGGMSRDEQGWVVAALVAFLGIAYIGPAIARYRRKPSLKQRLAWRLQAGERRARAAGGRARRRVRKLGGSFRR